MKTKHDLPNSARKGIPIEDILEYRKKRLTCEEIATLTGCSKQNVVQRLKEYDLQGLDNFRQNKDNVFEHTQRKLINTLTDEDIKKASFSQRMLGVGLLQDKIQVLRGDATDITEHRVIVANLAEATERMRKAGLLRDQIEADKPLDVVDQPESAT